MTASVDGKSGCRRTYRERPHREEIPVDNRKCQYLLGPFSCDCDRLTHSGTFQGFFDKLPGQHLDLGDISSHLHDRVILLRVLDIKSVHAGGPYVLLSNDSGHQQIFGLF